MKRLLEHNADVNAVDSSTSFLGWRSSTARELAQERGHKRFAEPLLSHEAIK